VEYLRKGRPVQDSAPGAPIGGLEGVLKDLVKIRP